MTGTESSKPPPSSSESGANLTFLPQAAGCIDYRVGGTAACPHRDRADAGYDFTLGQMTVARQPLASIVGQLAGVALEKPVRLSSSPSSSTFLSPHRHPLHRHRRGGPS